MFVLKSQISRNIVLLTVERLLVAAKQYILTSVRIDWFCTEEEIMVVYRVTSFVYIVCHLLLVS